MLRYIVIKVGTALLVQEDGSLNESTMNHIVDGISFLKEKGFSPILVTSGAVAAGRKFSGNYSLSKGTLSAIGQPILMNSYSEKAAKKNLITAQYLITKEDVADRKRYICLDSSLTDAVKNGVIPIINDNDVLHEVRESFSDNDQLACYLGVMLNAEKVLLLTSVDGIYTDFGTENQKKIELITKESQLDSVKTDGKTSSGTGGMKGKIESLRLPMKCGIDVYVGLGDHKTIFQEVLEDNGAYTKIEGISESKKMKGIQKWLFAGAEPKGEIFISDIGAEILKKRRTRKSVLIKGVEKVSGRFEKGDVIKVSDGKGGKIGYGVAKMNSEEIESHKGEDDIVVIHANYFLVF